MFDADVFANRGFQDWCAAKPYLFCKVKANLGNWTSGEQKAILDFVGSGGLPRFSVYWNRTNYDGGGTVGAKSLTFAARNHDVSYYEAFVEQHVGAYVEDGGCVNGTKFNDRDIYGNFVTAMPTAKFEQPGLWTADLTGAQEYAAGHHGFYVVLMTNVWGGCGVCNSLNSNLFSTAQFQDFFRENEFPLVVCDSTC
jgi:hypothetical protein